ncbi:hypothetical protein EON79_12105 [bacterium]|nr:MAG: hypothetical protein EON79_12105 [bacterium]
MKLNLLPTTVSTERKAKGAVIGAVLIAVAGIIGGVLLTTVSRSNLQRAQALEQQVRPLAQAAVDTRALADKIISDSQGIIRNSALAGAMIGHSRKYPDLYEKILPYVPPFFRVTSISATPQGELSTVRIQGVLNTYQQYANLMLALLRIPGVQTVGRNGYLDRDLSVPNLTPTDQVGKPKRATDPVIPDDPLERLAYYQAQASTQTYTGTGNFGSPDQALRLNGPDSSLVEVTLVMNANIQAPDVSTTLKSAGGGGAAAATRPGGAGLAGVPGGGMPAGAGMPGVPGRPGGAPTRGGAGGDEER